MVSPVTRCTLRTEYDVPWGCNPVNIGITKNITPEEFDAACAQLHSDYQMHYRGRCGVFSLTIAASVGNIPLIEHIVRKTPKLLHMGTDSGKTPLCCAVLANQRFAAKKLIELGSDVNMANAYGITPLAFAAQKVYEFAEYEFKKYGRTTLHPDSIQKALNVAMAKLLLLNGAVAEPAVNEKGAQVLQQAQKEIDEMRTSLVRELYNAPELADVAMPLELVKMMAGYVPLDEIPETVPDLPDPLDAEDPYRSEFPDLPPVDK